MVSLDVEGRPYFEWMDEIKEWIKNGENEKAERLLLIIIDFIEKYDNKFGVAPAYYERLAILYSKLKRFSDEYRILLRYSEQKHATGKKAENLMKRLENVKNKIGNT